MRLDIVLFISALVSARVLVVAAQVFFHGRRVLGLGMAMGLGLVVGISAIVTSNSDSTKTVMTIGNAVNRFGESR
jgi:membrane protein YqaA with SNARE-associated domain